MPLERLEKQRPDGTPGLHPVRSQVERAKEPERSQPVICREIGSPYAVPRADAINIYPQVRVTPKDVKPVEHKANGRPEPSTRDKTADFYTSVDEDYKHTRDELVMTKHNDRPEPTGRARPAHQYISLTDLNRIQRVESDKRAKEAGASESEVVNSSPGSDEGNIAQESSEERDETGTWDMEEESSEGDHDTEDSHDDEESSEGHVGTKESDADEGSLEGEDDTEESDDEEEYLENDDENDSETASDASSPAPQRSQYFQATPRRASVRLRELAKKWPKEPSKATTPKRKTPPSQLTSDKGMKQRKRVKQVIEESDDSYEGEDKEDGKGEAADRRVPHNVNRPAKIFAQGKKLSSLQGRLPLSRNRYAWTKEEEETLFNLREQGKTWKYIGECVLGRTGTGVKSHWCRLRIVALKPIEAQTSRRRRPHNSSVVSLMAKTLKLNEKPTWSKEQDEKLISLRTQGLPLNIISRRIQGKRYKAVWKRWSKIKNRYPQVVPDSEESEPGKKGIPSIRQNNSHFSLSSQCDGKEKEAEWNVKPDSHSAMVERESSKSSTNGDPPIDADVDTLSAMHPYHIASKTNATLTKDHDQRTPKLVASGQNALPYTESSVHTGSRKELSHGEQRVQEALREHERHLRP